MKITTKISSFKQKNLIRYLDDHFIHVFPPECIEKRFSELPGMESEKAELVDAINYLTNLEVNQQNPVLAPYSKFMLTGAPGSGKTVLIASIAKEANVPLIRADMTAFAAYPDDALKILETLFMVIHNFTNGCVVHFQNFSAISSLPPETIALFHNEFTEAIANCTNAVIVLSSIEQRILLPILYYAPNVFPQRKVININIPTLNTRTLLFDEYIKKYEVKLAEDVSTERLARNTLGFYPKDIEYVVREIKLYASRKQLEQVTLKEFNDVMLNMYDSKTHAKMSEKEKRSTAYHEAGHVIAAYFSNPDYILGRVEITPRSASLGLTQEESGEEKYSMFKSDIEKEIIYTLGGMAAERLVYGENTSSVSSDIECASTYACAMFGVLGMSDTIGPLCVDGEQCFGSVDIYNAVEKEAQEYLKKAYSITLDIISSHRPEFEALTHALVEKEVLTGEEINAIINDPRFGPPDTKKRHL